MLIKKRTYWLLLAMIALLVACIVLFITNNLFDMVQTVQFINIQFLLVLLAGNGFLALHVIVGQQWISPIKNITQKFKLFVPVSFVLSIAYIVLAGNSIPDCLWAFLIKHISIYGLLFAMYYLRFKSALPTNIIALVLTIIGSFVLSIDYFQDLYYHFHSTLLPWYILISALLMALAIFNLVLLKQKAYLQSILAKNIANYLFAFVCIWAYLWFSQFLLIWYGNLPHETEFYLLQIKQFPVLFYVQMVLCFFIPFITMFTSKLKSNKTAIAISAISIVIGQYINMFVIQFTHNKLAVSFIFVHLIFISFLLFLIYILNPKVHSTNE